MKVTRDATGKVISTTTTAHTYTRGCLSYLGFFIAVTLVVGIIASIVH